MNLFNFLYLFDVLKFSNYLKYSNAGYDERPILNNETSLSTINQNFMKMELLEKLEDKNISIHHKLNYIQESDLFYLNISSNISRGLPQFGDW
jgi:hypothetical protein